MANRTYLIWHKRPETVPYPLMILKNGVVIANVYTIQSYQDQSSVVEVLSRAEHWLPYDGGNILGTKWRSLSRCQARKFMRKYYPDFDAKLL